MKGKNKYLAQPFVKWAGGKRQLFPEINKYIPTYQGTYYEPFLGGGAVLLNHQPPKFIANDVNHEIINVYNIVKNHLDELIEDLKKHKNESDYFYKVRELDRDKDRYAKLTPIEKASRILFLNKTCFNGLFRVNRKGQFNVPFGRYKNPKIVNETTLKAVNEYLNAVDDTFISKDYKEALDLENIKRNSFIYFDPPYDPISDSSSFTGYSINGFTKKNQQELKEVCDILHSKNCKFLLDF